MKIRLAVLLFAAPMLWGQENVTCTNSTLSGNYGFTVTGTRPSAPGSTMIESVVGVAMTNFDGNGNLTQTDNIHGSISGYTAPDRQGTGTYNLNPDCTGTMQLSSPGSPTLTLRILVVDNGNEVRAAVVNPLPVMVTSNGRRTTQRSGGGFVFAPDIRKPVQQ